MAMFSSEREDSKIISYCIPVLNRSDELLSTLAFNLEESRAFQSIVEFIVLIYDKDAALYEHLLREYAYDIQSGYLAVARSDVLNSWHFGRAKNGFKPIVRGALYSSLDADNFVTADETRFLLRLFEHHGGNFIHHGFSGSWGDGTSGRLTTGRRYYREIGYDSRLMPRQFDEFDFMLSVVRQHPALPIIWYSTASEALDRSPMAKFMRHEGLGSRPVLVSRPEWRAPLHPKGKGYAARSKALGFMQVYNRSLSFAKNTRSASERSGYYRQAWEAANRLVDVLSASELLALFFDQDTTVPAAGHGGISVFSCLKDEGPLVASWISHHRALGVTGFYFINDGSHIELGAERDAKDVHVFSPVVGAFRSCKSAWIRALMKAVVSAGDWVLTVDGDEYIEIVDPPASSLAELAGKMQQGGRKFVPGLLVDMLPSADWLNAPRDLDEGEILAVFGSHLWEMPADAEAYADAKPIRWGFGPYWRASAMVDARHRVFGTLDSLRKVPFFRYGPELVLNQGFHDLHRGGRGLRATEVWSGGGLLAVKHYKLAKMLAEARRATLAVAVSQQAYHERTRANIARMLEVDADKLRLKLLDLKSVTFDPSRLAGLPSLHQKPRWLERLFNAFTGRARRVS